MKLMKKQKYAMFVKKDLRNFFQQHIIFTLILILIGLGIIISNSAMLRLNSDSTGTGKLTSETVSKGVQKGIY